MNRRFDTEHESGSTRTAFEALRASRPRTPAELTSVDTEDAEDMFWRIVGDVESQPRRHRFRRRHFTLAVSAAAAAAVIGVLVALPAQDTQRNAGTPASTAGGPTTTAIVADEWPEIEPAPAIGEANTTRARLLTTTADGIPVYPETYTLVDGDVAIVIELDPTDGHRNVVEHRYIGGDWYARYPDEDGDNGWEYYPDQDPDTIPAGLSPSDPLELYDNVSPTAGFEHDGSDFVYGIETVHLVATTPDSIDPKLLPFGHQILDLVSLDLWVDSNGVTRRVDITFVNPWDGGSVDPETIPPDADPNGESLVTYSIEYYSIGDPMTIDVPRGAVER